jgi:hypothetical protein
MLSTFGNCALGHQAPQEGIMKKTLAYASMLLFLTACSVTNQAKVSDVTYSGFLSNYSQLKPTNEPDKVLLRYIDPSAKWSSYTSVRLEPVTFWAPTDSKISIAEQQRLSDYAYSKLLEALKAKGVHLTDKSAPGVIVIRVALTDATSATPVLRTISVVVPQARLLNAAAEAVTGQNAFAGGIQTEGEALDGVTGKRVAAWVDKRFGGSSIETADVATWGDAENAINLWASLLATRIVDLRMGKPV